MGGPGKRGGGVDPLDPEPPEDCDLLQISEESLADMSMDELRDLARQTVNDIAADDPELGRMSLIRALLAASV